MIFSFRSAPEGVITEEPTSIVRSLRHVSDVLKHAMTGKLNCLGEVTLTASVASTVITDARLSIGSYISFDPVTANAAAEKAAGTIYVTEANRRNGAFTVTHANNAQTDRTFKYLIIG